MECGKDIYLWLFCGEVDRALGYIIDKYFHIAVAVDRRMKRGMHHHRGRAKMKARRKLMRKEKARRKLMRIPKALAVMTQKNEQWQIHLTTKMFVLLCVLIDNDLLPLTSYVCIKWA